MEISSCHCGESSSFEDCCQTFISGAVKPKTAEQLMRSRFTAFKLRLHQYLVDTQFLEPDSKPLTVSDFDYDTLWLGLEIIPSKKNGLPSNQEEVEFVAFYQTNTPLSPAKSFYQLHERSLFYKLDGKWLYVNGQHLADIKYPRNKSCFCNSGKKFKKCHAQ